MRVSVLSFLIILFLLLCPFPVQAQVTKIRVALFIDSGTEASEFTKEFRRNDDDAVSYRKVNGDDIRNGALMNFDALVIPGGSAHRIARGLGADAREEIRRFVRDGGIYLGVCAGAYMATKEAKSDLGFLPVSVLDADHWYRVDEDIEATIDVELTPAAMEVFGFDKSKIKLIYCNGPIFSAPIEKADESYTILGTFRSEVVAEGGKPGLMLGSPAIVMSRYGRGIVLAISPHPEETPGAKQSEIHAIHWLYDHRLSFGKNSTLNAQASNHGPTATSFKPKTNKPIAIAKENHSTIAVRFAPVAKENSTAVKPSPNANGNTDSLGEQALMMAESIFDQASTVRYVHRQAPASRQVITDDDGTIEARTDCSGFASYIVHAIAPRHYKMVRSREPEASYPQAKIWARFFDDLDSDTPRDGWLRINDWRNLKPGDLIAWEEGASSSSGNTGHVMFAMGKPGEIQVNNGIRYFEILVIDSSTVYHFPPERLPPKASQRHRDGVGTGMVRILVSDDGRPIGYWAGTYWGEGDKPVKGPTLSKLVRFARMIPLSEN